MDAKPQTMADDNTNGTTKFDRTGAREGRALLTERDREILLGVDPDVSDSQYYKTQSTIRLRYQANLFPDLDLLAARHPEQVAEIAWMVDRITDAYRIDATTPEAFNPRGDETTSLDDERPYPFSCPECADEFEDVQQLARHQRDEHAEDDDE